MNNSELQLFPDGVETWSAVQIVRWASRQFGDGLVLTCSFGGGGIVLAHMVQQHCPDVPIVFLDTGFHFPETLQFKEEFASRFNLQVIDVRPRLTVEEQAAQYGPELYARQPDLCCAQRKVEPLAAALLDRGVDGWMSALRRDQSPTRKNIRTLEWHTLTEPNSDRRRRIVKVHPLASWTRGDVERYIADHDLPRHPLLDEGYTSIGCAPCTALPLNGDGERSGRWAGTGKTECGLHTFTARSPAPQDGSS